MIGIVFNPTRVERSALEEALAARKQPVEVEWYATTVEDAGQGMARQALADGCGLVVAVGGDGTIRDVAATLAGTEVPLGIVPQGTGNLLARNLGIPLGDVAGALARAIDGDESPIDIGRIELHDRGEEFIFLVMAGFGIDAQMLAETDESAKERAGWLAYVGALGRAMAATDVVDATVVFDADPPVTEPTHTVLIGNCGTVQGGLRILPDAEPDDGLLDVVLIGGEGPEGLQWLDALKSVVWDNGIRRAVTRDDTAVDTATTRHRQAVSVRVTLPEPLPFEIDGEEVGATADILAIIQPGALLVRR
ncbi:NAD(+)/NADH kinase [Microbacterium sp. zg.Y1090]|uniref:diacylglycerol/lipid kinase family protein n=1 Tax=Microbacterium TaxID=33882 RepID=UPI00214CE2CF|nr:MULTISPECIES: diacylglycerol kinase family protein [unclassified Microbacterium]MCR2812646.1 NAD(+)/NADH kinase [Microbacterium sp. zg.Y1084]MCR2817559.1 NAD(+)/NADH kinase [Microbacterium sp. zg.Y1090]MDL5485799.1 diacylglycerol kinase family protein [Microbacterium sp. zg-Y1211]WIM28961.1 diacylglycerol kinase family protein [Microbacterium sp. zg-Y1090]